MYGKSKCIVTAEESWARETINIAVAVANGDGDFFQGLHNLSRKNFSSLSTTARSGKATFQIGRTRSPSFILSLTLQSNTATYTAINPSSWEEDKAWWR
jgi:hypothetical protein